MHQPIRRRYVILAVVPALAMAVASTAHASAPTARVGTHSVSAARFLPGEDPLGEEVWANQETLFAYSDWLASQGEKHQQGYVFHANDANTLTVTLYWESDKLDASEPYVREADRRGFHVRVVPRQFSRADLDSTADQVNSRPGWFAARGYTLDSVYGVSKEVDGVEVRLVPRPPKSSTPRMSAAALRASLQDTLPAAVTVHVISADEADVLLRGPGIGLPSRRAL